MRCFLNGFVENASRKGKGGRAGSKRSTTSRSRARSVVLAQIALLLASGSRSSVVNRLQLPAGVVLPSLASLGSIHGGSRGGMRPGTGSTGMVVVARG